MGFDKSVYEQIERRKEPVRLIGGEVWVWAMNTADWFMVTDKADRPKVDPRGGIDRTEAVLWQILLSCYDSDAPDAKRVFGVEDVMLIHQMPWNEVQQLLTAINRVNGIDAEEADLMRDFTALAEASPSGR